MQSHLQQMHELFFTFDIQCQFVNGFVEMSQTVVVVHHTFVQLPFKTSEQSDWSSMSRTVLHRVSKPLKWRALSSSANVSIGWTSSSINGSSSVRIVSITLSTSSNIRTRDSLMFVTFILKKPLICYSKYAIWTKCASTALVQSAYLSKILL